jgi:hypothetical protein
METSSAEILLNKLVEELEPVTTVIHALQMNGYTHTFELICNKLMCKKRNEYYYPSDFQVEHIERIEQLGYLYALRHRTEHFMGIFTVYLTVDLKQGDN